MRRPAILPYISIGLLITASLVCLEAIYQRYLGFFDGNPAHLHPLPPETAGQKYVEFMGGAESLLAKAREAFDKGEYRWVAKVVNHLVFADSDNQAACALQADALEQLGYQAESGPWRNFYLSAAKELRDGVLDLSAPKSVSSDTVRATPLAMFFDLLAVRLIGPRPRTRLSPSTPTLQTSTSSIH